MALKLVLKTRLSLEEHLLNDKINKKITLSDFFRYTPTVLFINKPPI